METIIFCKKVAVRLSAEQARYCRWQSYMLTNVRNEFMRDSWNHYLKTGKLLSSARWDKEYFPSLKFKYMDPDGNPLHGQSRQDCLRCAMVGLRTAVYGRRILGTYVPGTNRPPFASFEEYPYRHIHFPNTIDSVRLSESYVYIPFIHEVTLLERGYLLCEDLQYITSGNIIWEPKNDKWHVQFFMEVPADYFQTHHPIPDYDHRSPGMGIDLGYHNLITRTGSERILPIADSLENPMIGSKIKKLQSRFNALHRRMNEKIRRNMFRYGYNGDAVAKDLKEEYRKMREAGDFNKIVHSKNLNVIYQKMGKIQGQMARYRNDLAYKIAAEIVSVRPEFVCVEGLRVTAMRSLKSNFGKPSIRRYNSKIPYGTIRRRIEWACKRYGIVFIVADHYFKSSKRCGLCGHIGIFKSRNFICVNPECPGYDIPRDRDENAADNLFRYGVAEYYAHKLENIYDIVPKIPQAIPRPKQIEW